MKIKQLSIRLYGVPIGILKLNQVGKMQFTYDNDARSPISISMPIREEPYPESYCEAFFGGLLPESETARKILGKIFNVSPTNSFALLKEIGHDCAGAISCHLPDEPIEPDASVPIQGKTLSEQSLYKHITELPLKPLFLDVEGLRLSLAGVQDKAAICVVDDQVIIPDKNCPTTQLIKPGSRHFPGLVENEYLMLKIANRLGLPVPNAMLRKINDISFILIERYDRQIENNLVSRIHQEDFCQALAVKSNNKYQNEGGPGFKLCFQLLNSTAQPAIARNLMASATIFNFLTGNMDAHAKNFSLLHHKEKYTLLAPFYDLVCTRAYPALTDKMAMKIGKKYKASEVDDKQWSLFCEEINYRHLALKKMIEKMANSIIQIAQQEINKIQEQDMMHPLLIDVLEFLETNIEETVNKIQSP